MVTQGPDEELSSVARLGLDGCQIEHATEPSLDAERLACGVLALIGARAVGHTNQGAVRLVGARIGGQFDCDGAELRNDSGPALHADGLQVGHTMYLRGGLTATGSGGGGAVRLIGAHIGINLEFDGAEPQNDSGPALDADGLQVGQDMYLSGGFTATGGGGGVAVNLTGARVGGTLWFGPARLEHAADPCRRLAVAGLTYAGVPEPVSARGWLRLLRDAGSRGADGPARRRACSR